MSNLKFYEAPKSSANFPTSLKIVEKDGKKVIETGLQNARSAEVVDQIGTWVIARFAGRMAQGGARSGTKSKYAPTEYYLVNSAGWQEYAYATPGRGRACQTVIKEMKDFVAARTPVVS